MKNYGWKFMTLYRSSDQKHAQEKKCPPKAKFFSDKALEIAEKRSEVKGKGEKER